MAYPKIRYATVNGDFITFQLKLPPTSKPGVSVEVTRTDIFSTGGVRQSTIERQVTTLPVTMNFIFDYTEDDASNDKEIWAAFLVYAAAGGQFTYFADGDDDATGRTMFMVENKAVLKWVSAGVYSFTGTFQEEV